VSGYEQLLELARRELDLVEAGRWEDAAALEAERRELVAALPMQAPAEARDLLERTRELVRRTAAVTDAELAAVRAQLTALRRMRPALATYVGATGARRSVELTG